MRIAPVCLLVALYATTLSACVTRAQSRPPVPLKSVVLRDVQGLFGGQNLWASADGTAFVQTVGHSQAVAGLAERRSRLKLTAAQWSEIERLVGAHGLLTLKTPQRSGVPDEAHPNISLVTRSGTKVEVGKWADDKVPDFDAVYQYLLQLTASASATGELLNEGLYDWKWHPDGF